VRVAVVGATGVVGKTILQVLDERDVPVDTLLAYASRDRVEGVQFRGENVPVAAATRERHPRWRRSPPMATRAISSRPRQCWRSARRATSARSRI